MISITQKIRNRVTRMTKRLTISKNYRVKSKTTEEWKNSKSRVIWSRANLPFPTKGQSVSMNYFRVARGGHPMRSAFTNFGHPFENQSISIEQSVFILFYRPKSRKLQSYYQIAHFVESKSYFFSIWLLNK